MVSGALHPMKELTRYYEYTYPHMSGDKPYYCFFQGDMPLTVYRFDFHRRRLGVEGTWEFSIYDAITGDGGDYTWIDDQGKRRTVSLILKMLTTYEMGEITWDQFQYYSKRPAAT